MKITRVETRQLSFEDGASTLVFLRTDSGISGLGETSNPNQPDTLRAAIEEVAPRILGFDPFNANAIGTTLISMRDQSCGGVLLQVVNGVEAACLDIVGKSLGVPVTQLFGGSLRDEVRLCATCWEKLDDFPEDYGRKAHEIATSGFTAIKFDPFGSSDLLIGGQTLERAVEITRRIRETVGTDIDLIADANGRFTPSEAVSVARALEPFNLMWLEDPLQTDEPNSLGTVARSGGVPLSIGERVVASHKFREVIERQLVDFIQLDCHRVGGVFSARGIALLAQTYCMGLALHHCCGPVTLAINAQVGACFPHFVMMEFPYPPRPSWEGLLKVPLELRNGFLKLPQGPGWGIEYATELNNLAAQTKT